MKKISLNKIVTRLLDKVPHGMDAITTVPSVHNVPPGYRQIGAYKESARLYQFADKRFGRYYVVKARPNMKGRWYICCEDAILITHEIRNAMQARGLAPKAEDSNPTKKIESPMRQMTISEHSTNMQILEILNSHTTMLQKLLKGDRL